MLTFWDAIAVWRLVFDTVSWMIYSWSAVNELGGRMTCEPDVVLKQSFFFCNIKQNNKSNYK